MQFKEVPIGKIFTYELAPGEKQTAIKVAEKEALTIPEGERVTPYPTKRVEWPEMPGFGYVGAYHNEPVIFAPIGNTGKARIIRIAVVSKGYIIPVEEIAQDLETRKLLDGQGKAEHGARKVDIISEDIITGLRKVLTLAEALKVIEGGV